MHYTIQRMRNYFLDFIKYDYGITRAMDQMIDKPTCKAIICFTSSRTSFIETHIDLIRRWYVVTGLVKLSLNSSPLSASVSYWNGNVMLNLPNHKQPRSNLLIAFVQVSRVFENTASQHIWSLCLASTGWPSKCQDQWDSVFCCWTPIWKCKLS